MNNGYLGARLVWQIYQIQLLAKYEVWYGNTPCLDYGAPQSSRLEVFSSFLGINWNIIKELQTLPVGFLGLGPYDLVIKTMISRVQIFLWNFQQPSLVVVTLQASIEYLQLKIVLGRFHMHEKFEIYG